MRGLMAVLILARGGLQTAGSGAGFRDDKIVTAKDAVAPPPAAES